MGASPDEEVLTLRTQLQRWAEAYFERDAPVVPDADYDQAMRRLQALEQAFPDLVTPDSPTPLVPSGEKGERVSWCSTSKDGTSTAVGSV